MKYPRFAIFVFVLALFQGCANTSVNQADEWQVDPTRKQALSLATNIISRVHYNPKILDDSVAEHMFEIFFDSLDSEHMIFTQAQIDQAWADRHRLDDAVRNRDFTLAVRWVATYKALLIHRMGAVLRYIDSETFEEDIVSDLNGDHPAERQPRPLEGPHPSNLEWAQDAVAIEDRWRRRLQAEAYVLQAGGAQLDTIRETLRQRYQHALKVARDLDGNDAANALIGAYVATFDPHTAYLTPFAGESMEIALSLSLEGVGAILGENSRGARIDAVTPGGPADRAGLVPGALILAVAQGTHEPWVGVEDWRLPDIVKLIRGPRDSTVRVQVLLPPPLNEKREYVMVRDRIRVPEAGLQTTIIEPPGAEPVLWLKAPVFYRDLRPTARPGPGFHSLSNDIADAITQAREGHGSLGGVILDVRNNGGGILDEALAVAGLFLPEDTAVVQVKSRTGAPVVLKTPSRRHSILNDRWQGPLVVIVNRNSASASEIVAAALQDHSRAIVVGEQTHGKGTVQNLINLDDLVAGSRYWNLGRLKITVSQFFRVTGASTQLHGVMPDIGVASGPMDQAGQWGERNLPRAMPASAITAVAGVPPPVSLLKHLSMDESLGADAPIDAQADVPLERALDLIGRWPAAPDQNARQTPHF